MKKIWIISLLIIIISISCPSQIQDNYCKDFRHVIEIYQENCFNRSSINDINKEEFINDFILTLDPYKVLLSQDDIIKLIAIGKQPAHTFTNLYCENRESIIELFNNSLQTSLTIIEELKKREINYKDNDSIFVAYLNKIEYYKRDKKQRWVAFLKYQILQKLSETSTKIESLLQNPDSLRIIISNHKQRVLEQEKKRIENILNTKPDFEYYLYFRFINSLLIQLDPHSFYFSKEMFTGFSGQLSSFTNSFGIQIDLNQYGKYIISAIVPGSSAWRNGQLNIGDELIAVKLENKEPLFFEYAGMDGISEYINSSSSDVLILTVKKNNKVLEDITLKKEKLLNNEAAVQSYILSGQRKIGYILLPAFFTSWESENTLGCAQDVAKAIYALKKENIEALILDLRNNSGGSIIEAIELAGIFIDFGNLSIGQNRNNELFFLKDFNRGIMYAGPMAILINKSSASASEMVASVLQDYNRAIIIGEETFGKASGQILIPIGNSDKQQIKGYNNLNTLKVTTSRYFRVTGKSYQKLGVSPDLALPYITPPYLVTESDLTRALNNDSINKKIYFNPLPKLPIDYLRIKSEKRMAVNKKFQAIVKTDSLLDDYIMKYTYIPLELNKYNTFIREGSLILNEIDKIANDSTHTYSVNNLSSAEDMIKLYEYHSNLDKHHKESILSDPYINETFNILIDYILILKNQYK